jgi:hypothetical protein
MNVLGFCPMGCGQTLHATGDGFITCLAPGCERPAAVTGLLMLRDVIEHRLTLSRTGFQVVHPLRERFGDLIAHCPLDDHLKSLARPPAEPGIYLAEQQSDGQWVYSPWTKR